PPAARERDRQLCEGRATAARAHRRRRLRPGPGAALHRLVGQTVRARARRTDGSERREGPASVPESARAGFARRTDRTMSPLPATTAPRRKAGAWLVAGAVGIPPFMEGLDTTIPNVALPSIPAR